MSIYLLIEYYSYIIVLYDQLLTVIIYRVNIRVNAVMDLDFFGGERVGNIF